MKNVLQVATGSLTVSQVHEKLYGASEEIDPIFIESVKIHGILTPLIITPDNVVVSGVLRLRVALQLQFTTVPAIYLDTPLEGYQVAMLNLSRQKLPSMLYQEYLLLKPWFEVGKGKRTDKTGEKPKLDLEETLGVPKSRVRRLHSINNYANELYGSTESSEYKKVWENLDKGTWDITKAEKILKKEKIKKDFKAKIEMGGKVELPGVTIHRSSSKDLKEIENETIQTIICSPPYFGKLRDYETGKDQLGWEKSHYEFITRLAEHFDECKRVLKKRGSLFVNLGDFVVNREYRMVPAHFAIEMAKRGWRINDRLVWSKNNPMPTDGKRTLCCTEEIFHFVLTSHFDFDLDWINDQAIQREEIREGDLFWGVGTPNARPRSFFDFRGDNVIRSNASSTSWLSKECKRRKIPFTHSATFPEIIPEIFIRSTSKENDKILDVFSGTSTVGAVASVLGREYIGYELNSDYIAQAQVRLDCPEQTKSHLLKAA